MAPPITEAALLKALREEGCKIAEVGNWPSHNRNSQGAWGPVHGVMIHHTVTSGSKRTVEIVRNGYDGLPGPLSLGAITKDGTVHLVGLGRANHAGLGDSDVLDAVVAERRTPAPTKHDADGNARFYGFECENLGNGSDLWPAAQLDAIERASAAICRYHGWNEWSVIGHLEWTNRKIDPRGFTMDSMRERVAERLKYPAGWSPGGNEEEDDVPEYSLYSTRDYEQPLPKGEWVTLGFNRRFDGVRWEDKAPEPSFVFGACLFSASLGVRLTGLEQGREAQVRLSRWREKAGGGWERASTLPIDSPVHDAGGGHFAYSWNSRLVSTRKERLRAEVKHFADGPVVVDFARAEALYWPL